MYINWLGLSCFKIQTAESTIITNPFAPNTGLKLPRFSAQVVILSNLEDRTANFKEGIKADESGHPPFVISGPGEYEVKNTFIWGMKGGNKKEEAVGKTIYLMKIEGVSLAFLGGLNHSLENTELEKLEGVDVLLIPVGGNGVLTFREASLLISQIEPRLVIPMEYHLPGLKLKCDPVSKFCREMGIKEENSEPKVKITTSSLPQEETKIVLLSPK